MNSATEPHSRTVCEPVPLSAHSLIDWMLKPFEPCLVAYALAAKKTTPVPTSSPMSPTRTVKNALSAERLFAASSHQCPISMNEQRPMISQPRISCTMFSASTIANIPALNNVSAAKKWV